MDLFEFHFSNLTGNLYYDTENDKYEMYSHKGVPKHINYLTFKDLILYIWTPMIWTGIIRILLPSTVLKSIKL